MNFADWWISTDKMAMWVRTSLGVIVDCAPIIQHFRGQRFSNLLRWITKQKGFTIKKLRKL